MSLGYLRRGKPNRPKRLKSLVIDEVSSVDRGAGYGVDVVLLKRERKAAMPTVTVEQVRDANADLIRKANAEPVLPANHYEEMMKRVAVANAVAVYQAKQFGKFRDNATTRNDDDVDSRRNLQPSLIDEGTDNGDDGLDWTRVDWNDTAQAAKAHRAEVARKRRREEIMNQLADEHERQRLNPLPRYP
jgi:hypothetical protein